MPYSFGSGTKAYRINEINVRVTYDGREETIDISISEKYKKYPNGNWKSIYSGRPINLFNNQLDEMLQKVFK